MVSDFFISEFVIILMTYTIFLRLRTSTNEDENISMQGNERPKGGALQRYFISHVCHIKIRTSVILEYLLSVFIGVNILQWWSKLISVFWWCLALLFQTLPHWVYYNFQFPLNISGRMSKNIILTLNLEFLYSHNVLIPLFSLIFP